MLFLVIILLNTLLTHQFLLESSTMFDEKSEITMVITSCGRMNLLTQTLQSFLNENDYPLKEIIVIDDCVTPKEKIWQCFISIKFPEQLKNNIKILVNEENLRLIRSIDRAYALVTTKYVLHFEDDWNVEYFRGTLAQAKEILKFGDENNLKISQVTFGRNLKHHCFRSELQWTNNSLPFFFLRHFADNPYHFSLNPFLMNIEAIYKKIFNGSFYETIAKPICEQRKKDMEMCRQYFPGRHLLNRGYRPVVIDNDVDEPEVTHLGFGYNINEKIENKGKKQTIIFIVAIILIVQLRRLILLNQQKSSIEMNKKLNSSEQLKI